MDQRTDEWFSARLGKVTASRVADVVAKTKSGWGASRANYMAELVAERLTGQKGQSFMTGAIQWGVDNEAGARGAYETERGVLVSEVGFIIHPSIPNSGASPDGLVEDDGLVEIKCPNTNTHLDFLLGGEISDRYILQMQWQMACTGRKWCDFVSYDPRMPKNMQLKIVRVPRDDGKIAQLVGDVKSFLDELDKKVKALILRYGENNA